VPGDTITRAWPGKSGGWDERSTTTSMGMSTASTAE
jgi:hypothetical protein